MNSAAGHTATMFRRPESGRQRGRPGGLHNRPAGRPAAEEPQRWRPLGAANLAARRRRLFMSRSEREDYVTTFGLIDLPMIGRREFSFSANSCARAARTLSVRRGAGRAARLSQVARQKRRGAILRAGAR